MRKILVTIAATLAMALVAATAPAEDNSHYVTSVDEPIMLKAETTKTSHWLAISEDGTALIDGRPVGAMDHDDIKAILSEMVAEYKKANENEIMNDYLFRQTDYLLDELQKCQDGKEERWKVIESTGTWSTE